MLACCRPATRSGLTGQRVGDDLVYWGLVAKFALELLGRQRFLPGMRAEAGGYVASWMPYLDDPADQARFGALTRTMPPVCRSVLRERQGAAHEEAPSPYTVLSSFIQYLVDDAVRSWAQQSPQAGELGLRPRRGGRLPGGRVGAAWWEALYAHDRAINVPSSRQQELGRLYTAWQSWTYHARPEATSTSASAFRPDPTDYGDDKNGDDICALVSRYLLPVARATQPDGGCFGGLARAGYACSLTLTRASIKPRKSYWPALGRAARLRPGFSAAVVRPTRGHHPDGQGGYRFLRETFASAGRDGLWRHGAALVEASPTPPERAVPRLHGQGRGRERGLLSMNTLQLDWELALGDETIRKSSSGLPSSRPRWSGPWSLGALAPEQVEAAIAFWERQRNRSALPLHEALGLALGVEHEIDGLTVTALDVEGWLGDLLGALDNREQLELAKPPDAFVGQLRPYQVRGLTRGWPFCGAGPPRPAWRMNWAWARRSRLSRCSCTCGAGGTATPAPDVDRLTDLLVATWARDDRSALPPACASCAPRCRPGRGERLLEQSMAMTCQFDVWPGAAATSEDLGGCPWERLNPRRGPNIKNPLTKQARPVSGRLRLPPGPDGDADREPPVGAVVDHDVPAAGLPGLP